MRYGKLPTELLQLPLDELFLNMVIAFPKILDKKRAARTRVEMMAELEALKKEFGVKETALGYKPTGRLLEVLKQSAEVKHGQ